MKYDPVMAALVKERGPSHPDYFMVALQEKVVGLVLEGRLDLRQPREMLMRQVRDVLQCDRRGQVDDFESQEGPAGCSLRRSGDPAAIIDEVCARYQVDRQDLLSACRRQDWAVIRFELFYRLRTEAGLTYKAIGHLVGGRHHSTVLHGIREWCRLSGLPQGRRSVPPKASHGFNGREASAAEADRSAFARPLTIHIA